LRTAQQHLEFTAPRDDNARLANLCGPLDENLRQIEQALDVTLSRRGHKITIRGRGAKVALTALENFYNRAKNTLSIDDIQLALVEARNAARRDPRFRGDPDHPFDESSATIDLDEEEDPGPKLYTRRADLRGRTPMQREYLRQIVAHDVTFGIGPAGTGKTYLAVACAVDALERDQVKRIVLTRPAVEAGERLGFLPGDLKEKIDPYLRPLYDALFDVLGERCTKLMETGIIEVAPLAFMRGRTLSRAFVILDEAQNCTPAQMKMFLTRLGEESRMVVTGDPSQSDLPSGPEGLEFAVRYLEGVEGVGIARFTAADVVRHPLVTRIVAAYDAHEKGVKPQRPPKRN
jgi:phosphate starvation-inducible PhoH-like protein